MAERTDELTELNRIRLDEDLTYEALAGLIRAASLEAGIDADIDRTVLYRALKRERKPNDRTLHKIQRFLDGRNAKKRGTRRRPS